MHICICLFFVFAFTFVFIFSFVSIFVERCAADHLRPLGRRRDKTRKLSSGTFHRKQFLPDIFPPLYVHIIMERLIKTIAVITMVNMMTMMMILLVMTICAQSPPGEEILAVNAQSALPETHHHHHLQFGTGQFGTKIIKTDNLAPGQFSTRTIWHRTIWHQDNLAPNI